MYIDKINWMWLDKSMNTSTSLSTSTITVSATHARNNFFELLNQVAAGRRIVIEKDKKEIAVLESRKDEVNHRNYLKAARAVKGILAVSDYDPLDNPLRKPGAKNFLGKWDKVLQKKSK